MPATLNYPGVYVEEIPSGVRPITGVATSIAAFVGWAAQGPADRAVSVSNWGDFNTQFGGLDPRSDLGYAVSQFFNNGGTQAYIIRLAGANAKAATATLDGLTFTATGPGTWAEAYKVVSTPRSDDPTRFRLDVVRAADGAIQETYLNLSLDATDSRFAQSVINSESLIVEVTAVDDSKPLNPGKTVTLAGGVDDTPPLQPGDAGFKTALLGDGQTTGVYLLKRVDLFNLLCVPGFTDATTLATLQKFCRDERAFLIADCAEDAQLTSFPNALNGITGNDAINAAFYFPWVKAPDPQLEGRLRAFPPCGFAAGIYARTDATRGVWKAPAGTDASLTSAAGLALTLTDDENGKLNVQAVNCLRNFPVYGTIVWGARTLQGNDERGSEWKYVPVRRMALFVEESLYRGLKWAVFEPNDEPLWAQIRLNVTSFMQDLFRKGAFQGTTPRDAYFVKCDKETTTQSDINHGVVNVVVGFAPLKPAEFVVLQIQQMAGQSAV